MTMQTTFFGKNFNQDTQNTVYYDPEKQQYYTTGITPAFRQPGFDWNSYAGTKWMGMKDALSNRNYLNGSPFQNSPVIQSLLNRQPYQYNAPTAQQMFPGMGNPMMGTMPNQSQGNPMLGGGLFGAGRFLGGNYANQAGLLGTSVSGT
jgi:hypothetical protein